MHLTNGIEKLALRAGQNGEIKQYTSAARNRLNKVSKSINTPPYKCDGEDRCCQLLIRGSERINWEEVNTLEELGTTERGAGGFGSTGGAVK
jgi:dUTPase